MCSWNAGYYPGPKHRDTHTFILLIQSVAQIQTTGKASQECSEGQHSSLTTSESQYGHLWGRKGVQLCGWQPNHAMFPGPSPIFFISRDLVQWIPAWPRGSEHSTCHPLCSPPALHSAVARTIHHLLLKGVAGMSHQGWGISVHLSISHSENTFPIFTTPSEAD